MTTPDTTPDKLTSGRTRAIKNEVNESDISPDIQEGIGLDLDAIERRMRELEQANINWDDAGKLWTEAEKIYLQRITELEAENAALREQVERCKKAIGQNAFDMLMAEGTGTREGAAST